MGQFRRAHRDGNNEVTDKPDNKTNASPSLIGEFWLFLKQEKKWWMIPLIAVLLIVGVLIVFASSSPLAPFLYPIF